MGPKWQGLADRQQSLLGHSGCRVGGNDLDIMLAFKQLMPLFGMGGETEKGIAMPSLPYWNAVATNDVPAQSDFYSTVNGRFLRDLIRDAANPQHVERLLKVYQQRLSYRLVRAAEESKLPCLTKSRSLQHWILLKPNWAKSSASNNWPKRLVHRYNAFRSKSAWR